MAGSSGPPDERYLGRLQQNAGTARLSKARALLVRLVARLALHHPAAAGFLVQLGWPDTQGENVLLDFVRRDLAEGMNVRVRLRRDDGRRGAACLGRGGQDGRGAGVQAVGTAARLSRRPSGRYLAGGQRGAGQGNAIPAPATTHVGLEAPVRGGRCRRPAGHRSRRRVGRGQAARRPAAAAGTETGAAESQGYWLSHESALVGRSRNRTTASRRPGHPTRAMPAIQLHRAWPHACSTCMPAPAFRTHADRVVDRVLCSRWQFHAHRHQDRRHR
jgi:hypothetical protein